MAFTQEEIQKGQDVLKQFNIPTRDQVLEAENIVKSERDRLNTVDSKKSPETFLGTLGHIGKEAVGDIGIPVGKAVSEFGQGAQKQLLQNVFRLAGLGERGLQKGLKTVLPKRAEEAIGLPQLLQEPTAGQDIAGIKELEIKTTPEKVGAATERIIEFFVPGLVAGKGTTAVKGATESANLLPVAKKILDVGASSVLNAAGTATIAAGQGDSKEEIKRAALIAGAIPIASEALKGVTRYLTEKLPARMMNRLLSPTRAGAKDMFSFGKNPGGVIAKEGIVAKSRQDLVNQISDINKGLGNQLDDILKNPEIATKTIDITDDVLGPIDDALDDAVKAGDQLLVRRLADLRAGLTQNFKLVGQDLVPVGEKSLKLTPTDILKRKREISSAAKWTGQAFDKEVNQVRVQIYRNLDKILDGLDDKIAPLNQRWANLITAEKALNTSIKKEMLKDLLPGIKELGIGGAIGLGSAARGEDPLEAAAKGLGATIGSKALTSTPVQTALAQALRQAPNAVELIKNIFLATANKKIDNNEEEENLRVKTLDNTRR